MNHGPHTYGMAKKRRVTWEDWNQQVALSCWIVTGQWPDRKTRNGGWIVTGHTEEVYRHALAHCDRADRIGVQIDLDSQIREDLAFAEVDFTETLTELLAAIPAGLRQAVVEAYNTMTPLPSVVAGIVANNLSAKCRLELDPVWYFAILRNL